MPVASIHADLQTPLKQYEIISDCIAGEMQVKFRRDRYLPRPNPSDGSKANLDRYTAYLTRAVFYNVTKRTLGGLVGQVFSREPIIEVPATLDAVVNDATGLGVGLPQLAKGSAAHIVAKGRGGLHIDYPNTGGTVTRAELIDGDIRPLFTSYKPEDIINWRYLRRGGRFVLTLVVLRGYYIKSDDGFLEVRAPEYKVLRLDASNEYTITTYRDSNNTPVGEVVKPTGPSGKPFNEIPFIFIGSETNDPTVDPAPLYDLSSLNIAHYRNSADFEESCYVTGQPTVYFTGLTERWVKDVLKGEIQMGARAAIPLPAGAIAGIIQADPNTLPNEAMKHKETQMVALGAKLVEPGAVQRTATEATIDQSYETSTLSASADNVSDAYTFALKWAARFQGDDEAKIKFELNTEFDLIKLSSNERSALIQEWQGQAITFGEMRANLRRAGIALLDDKEARKTILKEAADLPGADTTDPTGGNDPGNGPTGQASSAAGAGA